MMKRMPTDDAPLVINVTLEHYTFAAHAAGLRRGNATMAIPSEWAEYLTDRYLERRPDATKAPSWSWRFKRIPFSPTDRLYLSELHRMAAKIGYGKRYRGARKIAKATRRFMRAFNAWPDREAAMQSYRDLRDESEWTPVPDDDPIRKR